MAENRATQNSETPHLESAEGEILSPSDSAEESSSKKGTLTTDSASRSTIAGTHWIGGRYTARETSLVEMIDGWIQPLGYRVIHVELQMQKEAKLRVFIDFASASNEASAEAEAKGVSIEDVVKVTKAINEPLDQWSESSAGLRTAYELEISSPGMNRPLRRQEDFERFGGERIRVHTVRPATADELGNEEFWSLHSKRKNFVGTLVGLVSDQIRIVFEQDNKASAGKGKRKKKGVVQKTSTEPDQNLEIGLPLSIVSKVHLEPELSI